MRGFWRDNWVAHRLDVVVDRSDHARSLRIVGCPVADMTLRVSSNGKQLGRFQLRQAEQEAVTIEVPPGPREVITFAFSVHAVDVKGRPIAFLLNETNLFREEDLYSLA